MTAAELLRADLRVLSELIPQGARVLDVGCGDGSLLEHLRDRKDCQVSGIELSPNGVLACVQRGVGVVQSDLEEGLRDLPDARFDYVVVSQTLQEVRNIRLLLREVMRVGGRAVISYPNFAPLAARLRIGLLGRMPVSETLPHEWYDTPNVHYTTVTDFRALCTEVGVRVDEEICFRLRRGEARRVHFAPNLRADLAIAVVSRLDPAQG